MNMKEHLPWLGTFLILIHVQAFAQSDGYPLEAYLSAVQRESPDLIVEDANVAAAQARASGIRISPPMVGLMQMSEGNSRQDGYEISQELPFPTKIAQDKRVRNIELENQKANSAYQKVLILNEARYAYIEFWVATERLKILKDKNHWLKHHAAITRSATRSENTAQVHLLEVELERDIVENEVLAAEASLVEKRNSLKVHAPSLDVSNLVPVEPQLPLLDVTTLKRGAVELKELEVISLKAQEDLKQQSYAPDLFLRLRSFKGNDVSPQSQEIMVGVSLPFLYFWQPKAEVAETSAQRIRAEAELRKTQVEYESKTATVKAKLDSLAAQLKNTKEKLIPRAERRRKLAANISTRTMEGLDQHRSVELGLLDFRAKAIDLHLEYENLFKDLLRLSGGATSSGSMK